MLGVYVGAAWLSTFCLLPWFALGRIREEPRTSYASVNEQVEDGTSLGDWARPR